jgi:hypothetical protein
MLNLAATPYEDDLALKIVRRVRALTGEKLSSSIVTTELIACHLNACPLNLEAMLDHNGDPLQVQDVLTDLLGIHRHFNRRTGKLDGGWLPKFRRTT